MNKHIAVAILLIPLAACQKQDAAPAADHLPVATTPVPVAEPAPVAATDAKVVDAVPAVSSAMLSFEPSRMDACEPAIEAMVRWNVSSTPGIERVEVYTSNGTLFAAGTAVGEAKTALWTRPGTKLELRNPDNGKVLADTVMGGPVCNAQ